MERRFVAALSLLILVSLLLSACGQMTPNSVPQGADSKGAAEAAPVELTFVGWGGPEEQAVFKKLVEIFNTQNPGVVIKYTPIPDDYVTKLKTMIAGGTPPDIAYIPDGDFSAFVTKGQLVSIESFVKASAAMGADGIWPSALNRYRYDAGARAIGSGELYALPKDIGPTVIYINKDLFRQAGVPLPDPQRPLTWEQVIEIGRKITVDGNGNHPDEEGFDVNNVVVYGVGDIWFENTVYGNGGRVISEDGRTFIGDSSETVAAVQFLADLTHRYHIHPTSQQIASQSLNQMFESGRLAMTTNGRWATTGYRDTLAFDWDVIPNLVGPSGKIYAAAPDCTFGGWSGSVGVAIIAGSKGAQHAEQAYRFLEFIAGPEGQTEQARLGFQIPNQLELANSDVFLQPDQKPENAEIFLEAARCEFPGPWTRTPLYGQWFDDLWWQGVWPEVVVDGIKSADIAIRDRRGDFQSNLDEAWASLEQ